MKHRKILLSSITVLSISLGFCSSVYAANPGFYIGGQIGQTELFTSGNHIGLGGSILGGYQFNPIFSAEGEYIDFAKVTNNFGKIDQYAVGVAAKGSIPLSDSGFNLYGKAGVAYVQPDANGIEYDSHATFRPLYGVGMSYDFNPNLSSDISWTRIQTGNGVYNSQLIGIGLTYHFI